MRRSFQLFILSILLGTSLTVAGVEGSRATFTPPPAVTSSSIVQIIFSLLLVLAAIVLVAWLLKRINVTQHKSGNLLKVLGGVAIGQRERVVLVEVDDTWLVVGVGPGQIRTLHTLEKQHTQHVENSSIAAAQPENKFAKLLSSVIHHQPVGKK